MKKFKVTPENPKGILVDLTAEEEAQRTQDSADTIVAEEAQAAVKAQKATDKTNGNQKLLDLGLTQAEVDAITGQ